jgi:predicted DNA-binding transcriptional regulator YafY
MLPPKLRPRVEDTALFALSFRVSDDARAALGPIRRAVSGRRKLALRYRDAEDRQTTRVVRPLGLYFWGSTWTLGAWCELRADFRNFRLDRVDDVELLDEQFEHEPPVTLDDYARAMTADD